MKSNALLLIILFVTISVFAQVKVQKTEQGFLFTENNKKILFYQVEPKNHKGKYERCNYIHPLWGIDGAILTEDFPEDHFHHRGIFWAWHQLLIDDKSIGDGWALENFKQEILNVNFESLKDGSVLLKTQVEWKSNKLYPEGKEVTFLLENTSITIHKMKKNYRKIDFEISLLALVKNLKIGGSDDEKGYGGFSARIVLPDDVKFSGSLGEITPLKTAIKSDGFVNISGSLGKDSSNAGIVIVDHPQNPMYPQSWIIRKSKSMQNTVFPGRDPVAISAKNPLILKYSVLVYSGELSNEKIKEIME